MSSDSNHKSICKSIYAEAGFSGIITALKMFPERLHDEMLEELSMNMFEWECKLRPEEKEDMEKNLSSHAVLLALQDISVLKSLQESIHQLSLDEQMVEDKRDYLIKIIEEFPSILPETDIDSIAIVDEELETIRKRALNIGEQIDNLSEKVDKKTERRNDSLFE
ncbi:MAG: hypothetical protein PHG66_00750 [Candidatus Colwellbacteria bacterium]|nr:hypothetical protein [Candidatus Colwellbacteria bacterium]